MKNKTVQELHNAINKASHQLLRLRHSLDDCDKTNQTYNKLLIQRASMRKRLKSIQSTSLLGLIFDKFKKKPKQKLICDYFK